ncbi:P-loop NTPase fold protein [Streptomyces tauricus]|uniref:P-loop NTPase fold protein n=1 Tax=Streptomyces tauricus TaxID=68274 RepID=UPI0033ABB095
MAEIKQKLDALIDGTIAVCGPRGSGKTTLLEALNDDTNLRIAVQAPSSYAPLEFLTSLFVNVCETYMASHGARFPEFRRLSPLRAALRRLSLTVRDGAMRFLGGLLALGLVTVGVFAAADGFVDAHVGSFAHRVGAWLNTVRGLLLAVLDGNRPWVALAITVLGYCIWEYARFWRFTDFTFLLRWSVLRPLGQCFVAVPLVTLWSPRAVVNWFVGWWQAEPLAAWLAVGLVGSFVCVLLVGTLVYATEEWRHWDLQVFLDKLFGFVPGLVLACALGWVFLDDRMRHAAYGWDVPQRVALLVLGALVVRVSWLRRQPREAALVTQCRDHLYRLQTVQSVSYGTSGSSAAGVLGLGSNYGTSLTASPITLPELVQQLRYTLADIAKERRADEKRLVVTIDEIDRLGTTATALEFLGEIKVILGVPGVHFFISVSEDVGASFVRRGLPSRDLADSTFDDVIHVRPCTLQESSAILEQRVEGFHQPFVALVHALAGGVPRDLLRYAREIVALRVNQKITRIQPLAAWLITRELRETLNGFRSLLREMGLPDRSSEIIFGALRCLTGTLESGSLCENLCRLPQVKQQIGGLTRWKDSASGSHLRTELPATALQRLDEAASYAYFCLTLLDVFAEPDFDQHCDAVPGNQPDRHLERLAMVREELSFSPYSARPLITAFRAAWGLPEVPVPDGGQIATTVDMTC